MSKTKYSFSKKPVPKRKPETPSAFFSARENGRVLFISGYNGEKNLGEIGPPKGYYLQYEELRARGWESYLTNEIVQIIINRMTVWTIGVGLKLQSQPNETVLKSEGIKINTQEYSDGLEARWRIFSESLMCSYDSMRNLTQLQAAAYKNSKVGGDVLCVIRYVNGLPKMQLIDGVHVKSPNMGTDWNPQLLDGGNRIMNGVEMNEQGEHIAYHVRNADNTFARIVAKSESTGLKVAYLVGGLEFRLDNSRCIPILSGLFEIISKMGRYGEAMIGSAEEQAKIVYQIISEIGSSNESVIAGQIARARDATANDGTIPTDSQLNEMANKVAVSTNKQTFHMPNGSKLAPVEKNRSELYFRDFYSVFFDLACAAIGIPPNVAMSKYDTSFSSARAAIKDWEHTLIVERYLFALNFLQPFFNFWLHTEILNNKINAPGYLTSFINQNEMVLASYRDVRWVGDNVPHIDPVKEVEAERAKLGPMGANLPLTNLERSTEVVNGGESKSNMKQFAKEVGEGKTLGLIVDPSKEIKNPTKETNNQ